MTFPRLEGATPREGNLTCGSSPAPGAPACGAPATWHIAWRLGPPPASFSLVCDQHMAEVQTHLVYADRHRAEVTCDMPGTGWLLGDPSRCVVASTDDLTPAPPTEGTT